MPYVQVLAMKNSFAYIGFCLTDGILKPVVAGSEGGNGGRERAARTMKIATLYLCCSNRLNPFSPYNTSHIVVPDKWPPFTNTAQ